MEFLFLSYPGHASATVEEQGTVLTENEVIQQAVKELDTITDSIIAGVFALKIKI